MEVVSAGGIEVFLGDLSVSQDAIWESDLGRGYWLGAILDGTVSVEQDRFGRTCWEPGSAVAFYTSEVIQAQHRAVKEGNLSAVFVRIPDAGINDVLGEDGRRLLESDHSCCLDPCPGVISAIAWQMRASTLTGVARRCFLVAKALECVSQSIQQMENRCPLRSIAPRAYAWSARDIERFYEARAILLDALASPPPVTELARRIGVNARKLSDGFRDLFGEPIYAYVKSRRFEEAKRMLEAGEHSIGHVARTMGYQQQHFSTEFRRRYGVAPKSLRAKQPRHADD